jgi:hypothetical protein
VVYTGLGKGYGQPHLYKSPPNLHQTAISSQINLFSITLEQKPLINALASSASTLSALCTTSFNQVCTPRAVELIADLLTHSNEVNLSTQSDQMPSPTFPFLNRLRLITCVWVLLFGIWVQPASAVYFDSLEQKCDKRKIYSLVIKLLVVYASHIMTIKLQPGIGTYNTFESYLIAALLPSASVALTLRDFIFRRASFNQLPEMDIPIKPKNIPHYYNMQKAINAGAACFRVERDRIHSGHIVEDRTVRGKPLEDTEAFVVIPRGTPAQKFHPIMVKGNSQRIKAPIGLIQLTLATFQLVSTKRSQISAYGYGSFAYTIIPYAFGSLINLVGAMFTDSYQDVTEMTPVDEDTEIISPLEPGTGGQSLNNGQSQDASNPTSTQNTPNPKPFLDMSIQDPDPKRIHSLRSLGMHALRSILRTFSSLLGHKRELQKGFKPVLMLESEKHVDKWLTRTGLLLCALYLAIVGALSRFDSGISTRAERGWFLSWAIVGSIYGLAPSRIQTLGCGSGQVIICHKRDENTRRRITERNNSSRHFLGKWMKQLKMVPKVVLSVATIGGVVKLAQQYIDLYEC